MNTDYNNRISFNAKIGPQLKTYLIKNAFCNDLDSYNNFEKVFQTKLKDIVDENTIIEIKDKKSLFLYNPAFENITNKIKIKIKKDIVKQLIKTCDLLYSKAEYELFEKVISKWVNSRKSLSVIQEIANKQLDSERFPYFNDLIESATRILKKNPKSKLTADEFSDDRDEFLKQAMSSPEFQKLMETDFTNIA